MTVASQCFTSPGHQQPWYCLLSSLLDYSSHQRIVINLSYTSLHHYVRMTSPKRLFSLASYSYTPDVISQQFMTSPWNLYLYLCPSGKRSEKYLNLPHSSKLLKGIHQYDLIPPLLHSTAWASYETRKIAGCACAGMPGTLPPPPWVSDPDMHHGTCVMHVPWCMSESLTSCFLWSRWWGKRSRHSRRMLNQQFYVSGMRPILEWDFLPTSTGEAGSIIAFQGQLVPHSP